MTESFQCLSRTVSFKHLSGQWFSTARNHRLLTLKPARTLKPQKCGFTSVCSRFFCREGYQRRSPKSSSERKTAPSKDITWPEQVPGAYHPHEFSPADVFCFPSSRNASLATNRGNCCVTIQAHIQNCEGHHIPALQTKMSSINYFFSAQNFYLHYRLSPIAKYKKYIMDTQLLMYESKSV